jgi:cytochrome c556
MRKSTFVLAAAALAGGALLAQAATNDAVKARQDLMKGIGAATKVVGDMAQGKTPFDAAAAAAAKAELEARAAQIAATFETEATDPESEAAPEIWLAFDDFTGKADALVTAAAALDASSLESLQGGLRAVGGACGACHESYRLDK